MAEKDEQLMESSLLLDNDKEWVGKHMTTKINMKREIRKQLWSASLSLDKDMASNDKVVSQICQRQANIIGQRWK